MNENNQNNSSLRLKIIAAIFDLPWIGLISQLWQIARKIIRGLADEGVLEVIEQESTLELLDRDGESAIYKKRMKVRYIQNGIISYQDHGWADGKYLLDYQVSPGVAVDRYKIGYKHFVLISLREMRNKGDVDEFNIEWKIKKSFLKPDGYWQLDVDNRTKYLKLNVIFPKVRPPQSSQLVESNIRRTSALGRDTTLQLPDGRWQVTWETTKPRLNEQYIMRWDW